MLSKVVSDNIDALDTWMANVLLAQRTAVRSKGGFSLNVVREGNQYTDPPDSERSPDNCSAD